MILIIVSTFLIVYLLQDIYHLAFETRLQKYKFELVSLRDKVRQMAIEGEIDGSTWLFGYIESSIARTCDILEWISIYKLLIVFWFSTPSKELQKRHELLAHELKNPQNVVLKSLWTEYRDIVNKFLLEQHMEVKMFYNFINSHASSCIMRFFKKEVKEVTEFSMVSGMVTTMPSYANSVQKAA